MVNVMKVSRSTAHKRFGRLKTLLQREDGLKGLFSKYSGVGNFELINSIYF